MQSSKRGSAVCRSRQGPRRTRTVRGQNRISRVPEQKSRGGSTGLAPTAGASGRDGRYKADGPKRQLAFQNLPISVRKRKRETKGAVYCRCQIRTELTTDLSVPR